LDKSFAVRRLIVVIVVTTGDIVDIIVDSIDGTIVDIFNIAVVDSIGASVNTVGIIANVVGTTVVDTIVDTVVDIVATIVDSSRTLRRGIQNVPHEHLLLEDDIGDDAAFFLSADEIKEEEEEEEREMKFFSCAQQLNRTWSFPTPRFLDKFYKTVCRPSTKLL